MNLVDAMGWSAASLMVATFSCRDPRWMRVLAVCTNVAFISYAVHAHLAPVLALHILLLPINLARWWQATWERRHGRGPARCAAGETPHPLHRRVISTSRYSPGTTRLPPPAVLNSSSSAVKSRVRVS